MQILILHIIRHIAFFFKCMLDVSCNDGLVALKQDTHLFLREPNRLVFEVNIEAFLEEQRKR